MNFLTPEKLQIQSKLQQNASIIEDMSREENVLRVRLKRMEEERTQLYSKVCRYWFSYII